MALDPKYDGDVTKVPGAYLAVARNRDSGEFIGFYALTPTGIYIRGARTWITASGRALAGINGAQLIEETKPFIAVFDKLDDKGETPSDSKIAQYSTSGKPGSWDTQWDKPTTDTQ